MAFTLGWLVLSGYGDRADDERRTGDRRTGASSQDGGKMYENYWYWTAAEWYYFISRAVWKAKRLVLLADGWYYLDPESGVMARGVQTIGGQEYRFNASGHMYENQWVQGRR